MEYISSRGIFVVKIILPGVLVLVLKDLDVNREDTGVTELNRKSKGTFVNRFEAAGSKP